MFVYFILSFLFCDRITKITNVIVTITQTEKSFYTLSHIARLYIHCEP